MKTNCVHCGRELDCTKDKECWSDNTNIFTHPHLGGMQCRDCYAKTHKLCSKCDAPMMPDWKFCPNCGGS